MASNEPFGFDPEDLNRIFPGASDQLRGALGQFAKMFEGSGGRSGPFNDSTRARRAAPEPETTGEAGDGVWVVYTVDAEGGARVEQVYAAELDALRANKHNTDSSRRVRFLPYGIAVTVLDEPEVTPESESE